MALGKGLGAILEEVGLAYEEQIEGSDTLEQIESTLNIEELDVESIATNPYQPRKHFDENALQELSDSIVNHGLLQPIVVMEKGDGYLLIAGERRLRAHKLANLDKIKAIIADLNVDDVRLRELALIENIQREDLNSIELANSYAELIEVHNITHEELSNIVHKSRSQITNTMRLLTLSEYVQKNMLDGKISQGHAKVIVGLEPNIQKIIVDTIIGQKLNVRDAEKIAQKYKKSQDRPTKNKKPTINIMDNYSDDIDKILPFRHTIKKNKIEILFKDETEVKEFIKIIKKA
ncbi:Chromosome (plasmid) partitioning protein ParB [hydrothermal vent metagenome]|uniref:Chromosome (Plasmid) partitioning protein ParB n=1 Tax=hydrothermal vent metagenome TaxID=652676 RepID=A0A1W1C715_9ZZZZ